LVPFKFACQRNQPKPPNVVSITLYVPSGGYAIAELCKKEDVDWLMDCIQAASKTPTAGSIDRCNQLLKLDLHHERGKDERLVLPRDMEIRRVGETDRDGYLIERHSFFVELLQRMSQPLSGALMTDLGDVHLYCKPDGIEEVLLLVTIASNGRNTLGTLK